MNKQINVMVVDDHQMFLDGVTNILDQEDDILVVAALGDSRHAENILRQQQIDVLVSDISMPEVSGPALCKLTREISPHTRTLIVSMHEDYFHISTLLQHGACGYLPKNAGKEELIKAVRVVGRGETFYSDKVKETVMKTMSGQMYKSNQLPGSKLTRREVEVIKLIAAEYTSQQIADKLYISLNTAETHRKNIFRKTNAKNMAGLIRYALKNGVIE